MEQQQYERGTPQNLALTLSGTGMMWSTLTLSLTFMPTQSAPVCHTRNRNYLIANGGQAGIHMFLVGRRSVHSDGRVPHVQLPHVPQGIPAICTLHTLWGELWHLMCL